jgi:hypothetical protein
VPAGSRPEPLDPLPPAGRGSPADSAGHALELPAEHRRPGTVLGRNAARVVDPGRAVNWLAHRRDQGDRANHRARRVQQVTTAVAVIVSRKLSRGIGRTARRRTNLVQPLDGVHHAGQATSGATRGGSSPGFARVRSGCSPWRCVAGSGRRSDSGRPEDEPFSGGRPGSPAFRSSGRLVTMSFLDPGESHRCVAPAAASRSYRARPCSPVSESGLDLARA